MNPHLTGERQGVDCRKQRKVCPSPSDERWCGGLASVIMLAGAVRLTAFMKAIGRSVMDLPIGERQTVWDRWQEYLGGLAQDLGRRQLHVRLLVNDRTYLPQKVQGDKRLNVTVEVDKSQYRGTAGLLRDVSRQYDPQEYLLVVNAMQLWQEKMTHWVLACGRKGADVCLLTHRDGTPGGMMLIRCGILQDIAPVGYVDFKEQALPRLAQRYRVEVMTAGRATGMPIRTLSQYIAALRWYHDGRATGANGHPYREQWQSCFALVEQGARVDESVQMHDSVVLAGAQVSGPAVLVRSVVCGTYRGHGRSEVLDRLIGNGRTSAGD